MRALWESIVVWLLVSQDVVETSSTHLNLWKESGQEQRRKELRLRSIEDANRHP